MLDIHSMVVKIFGELPVELEFMYVIGDILLFLAILFVVFSPFILLLNLGRR